LYIFGGHESGVVAEGFEPAAQVMGADTGLHADEAGREVGKPGFELAAGELLGQNDGAALVEAGEVEGVLSDGDAEVVDGVFRPARQGPGSFVGSAPRSTAGYCGEHRRSIPLAELSGAYLLRSSNARAPITLVSTTLGHADLKTTTVYALRRASQHQVLTGAV